LLVTSREFASLCREALREQGQDGSLFLLEGRQAFLAAETIPHGDFENRCDADLPATYLLSSGSTGTPKRVGRTHAALACLAMSSSATQVSVVVPAYNAESTVADCVNSLLELHYPREQ